MRPLIFVAMTSLILPAAAHAQTPITVVPGQPWCMHYQDVEAWRIDPQDRPIECQGINHKTILGMPGEQDSIVGKITNDRGITDYKVMVTGPLADPGKETYVWVPRSSFTIPSQPDAPASQGRPPSQQGQTASPANSTPAFQQGLSDRQSWETWFASLSGDYRIGAEYWSGQRSKPRPGSCLGASGETLGDVTAGCLAARQRLAPADARRKTEPDYRLGFNSYSPATKPAPDAAPTPTLPAVSPPSPAPEARGTFTDKDIPMLMSHTDPNEFVDDFMNKEFVASGSFMSFERARTPSTVTLFQLNVMTGHGQVSCFHDAGNMPFQPGQPVVISGKLGMPLEEIHTLVLQYGCSVKDASGSGRDIR